MTTSGFGVERIENQYFGFGTTVNTGMFTWPTSDQVITTNEDGWNNYDKSKYVGEHTIIIQGGSGSYDYDITNVLTFKLIVTDPCDKPDAISFKADAQPLFY